MTKHGSRDSTTGPTCAQPWAIGSPHKISGLIGLAALVIAAACSSGGSKGDLQTKNALDQTVLGTAQSFAVLGGSAVTNTGATVVDGNLGVDPGLAVTGFPPGLVIGGTIHAGDAVALQAQSDTTTAYTTLAGEAPTSNLTGQDLGGLTLTAGVYHFDSSAQLTGTLTLDAQGDPNAVFVFQIGSTLTTASNSSVLVVNGASNCNVFWQVGSSATIGTTTVFAGNILALTSITLTTGATVNGRVLARNGAVTMDTNTVSILTCPTSGSSGSGGSGQSTGATGGPATGTAVSSGAGAGGGGSAATGSGGAGSAATGSGGAGSAATGSGGAGSGATGSGSGSGSGSGATGSGSGSGSGSGATGSGSGSSTSSGSGGGAGGAGGEGGAGGGKDCTTSSSSSSASSSSWSGSSSESSGTCGGWCPN